MRGRKHGWQPSSDRGIVQARSREYSSRPLIRIKKYMGMYTAVPGRVDTVDQAIGRLLGVADLRKQMGAGAGVSRCFVDLRKRAPV